VAPNKGMKLTKPEDLGGSRHVRPASLSRVSQLMSCVRRTSCRSYGGRRGDFRTRLAGSCDPLFDQIAQKWERDRAAAQHLVVEFANVETVVESSLRLVA
jgi:hypothetical protein